MKMNNVDARAAADGDDGDAGFNCGVAVQAAEMKYPVRPVRMLVSYPPGGPSDLTARLAAPHLSEALGQQFIIDNRGGAGGTLAVGLLTQAAHLMVIRLLMSAGGEIVIAPNLRLKLPYDPTKDIIPISRVGSSQLVLVVHPSVAAKVGEGTGGDRQGETGFDQLCIGRRGINRASCGRAVQISGRNRYRACAV